MVAAGSGGFTVPDEMANLGWANVMSYGAAGNGSTDDTAAVTAAIAALPAAGGVLYFPPGTYKTTGGFTLTTPCTVIGMGRNISKVTCTSGSASLFTVQSPDVSFGGLSLVNTAAGTPTAGAGINLNTNGGTTSGDYARYQDLTISGFWIDANITYGTRWHMSGCVLANAVSRALVMKNLNSSTGWIGEWTLESSWFVAGTRTNGTAYAIEWQGGSGGRIDSIEIISEGSDFWPNGLFIAPDSTLSGYLDPFLISNSVMNGCEGACIVVTVTGGVEFHNLDIVNCHLNPGWNGTSSNFAIAVDASAGNVTNIMVANCSLNAETATSNAAIALNNVDSVRVTGCLTDGFSGGVVSQTACSDVVVTASA